MGVNITHSPHLHKLMMQKAKVERLNPAHHNADLL